MLYEHLTNNLNVEGYSFVDQIDRKVVHELFLVVLSQFHRKEKYKTICNEISSELNSELYKNVLSSTIFKKSFFAKLMLWSLRKKKYFFIKIYSLIRCNRRDTN